MGIVYRARHGRSGEWAAIKTVLMADATLRVSLQREIHALSRLEHPGIVRSLAEGESDGRPWYAMELLDGLTLRQRLRRADAAARAPDAATVAASGAAPDQETAQLPARAVPAPAPDGGEWPPP